MAGPDAAGFWVYRRKFQPSSLSARLPFRLDITAGRMPPSVIGGAVVNRTGIWKEVASWMSRDCVAWSACVPTARG
jgi:hypothetical protein